jgi:hypothetical protein
MAIVERRNAAERREKRSARVVSRRSEPASDSGTLLLTTAQVVDDDSGTLLLTPDRIVDDSPDTLLLSVDQIVGQRGGRSRLAAGPAVRTAVSAPPSLREILRTIHQIINDGRGGGFRSPLVQFFVAFALAGILFAQSGVDIRLWFSVDEHPQSTQLEAESTPARTPTPPPAPRVSRRSTPSPLHETRIGQVIGIEEAQFSGPYCNTALAIEYAGLFAGDEFECGCFFDILYERQVPLEHLGGSAQRQAILEQARATCRF